MLPSAAPADEQLDHCGKDALTGFLGLMLQAVLAGLAFTCLIVKRFREPPEIRRSWEVWWYDTSKQGIGAIAIHLANVYLSPLFQGDPCTWYVINFLLDSTIGLLIVFIGIRLCQFLASYKKWPAINFGVYDAPKSWRYQTCIYIGLMALVKISTTLFIQWRFWNSIKDLVLSPFSNEAIELIMFMLVIPFFVNLLIFWVTDNFLMRHDNIHHKRSFFVDYIGRFRKNMSNGSGSGGGGGVGSGASGSFTANGSISGHNSTNGKKHTYSDSFQEFPQNCIEYRAKYQAVPDAAHRFDRTEYSGGRYAYEDDIDFNQSEFDALISGDERFDIDLIDDDCARLEPKHL